MNKKVIVALGTVALLGFSAITETNSVLNTNSHTVYAATKKKTAKQKLRSKFDKITVGDMANYGEGGSSIDDVKKLLGQPQSTTTDTSTGTQTDMVTWTKKGVTITVQFIEQKAIARSITGFEFSRKDTVGLAEFNALADGTSYTDVVAKFKEPDSITETVMLDSRTTMATWVTGVKGSAGANIVLTFTNDVLTGKTQTNLK